MYPLFHHIGFKCIVSFFIFAEYKSHNDYRRTKIELLKAQKIVLNLVKYCMY